VGSFKEMPLKFYDHPTKPTPSAKEIRAALAKRNPHLDPEHIDAIAQTSGASNPAGRGKNRLFINHSDNSVGRKYIKQELGIREEVEQVTEAEGKVAVTPREKDLAAHHGDPKKITYGDVIKARLKSAAAKKMGK
jgi:ribosomal protein S24E